MKEIKNKIKGVLKIVIPTILALSIVFVPIIVSLSVSQAQARREWLEKWWQHPEKINVTFSQIHMPAFTINLGEYNEAEPIEAEIIGDNSCYACYQMTFVGDTSIDPKCYPGASAVNVSIEYDGEVIMAERRAPYLYEEGYIRAKSTVVINDDSAGYIKTLGYLHTYNLYKKSDDDSLLYFASITFYLKDWM